MANHESSTKEMSSASAEKYLPPLWLPYSYLTQATKHSPEAGFAERALKISRGAGVIAEILRSDVTERDAGSNPLLDVSSIEALTALLSESMYMLSDAAIDQLDYLNREADKGAKA